MPEFMTETVPITARYNRSISELVACAKLGSRVNFGITDECFPEPYDREAQREAVLLRSSAYITTQSAEAAMRALRLRPGTIKELISVAIDHPEKLNDLPVVATGSIFRSAHGQQFVPLLTREADGWCLSLDWRGGYGWRGECVFLAMRSSAEKE